MGNAYDTMGLAHVGQAKKAWKCNAPWRKRGRNNKHLKMLEVLPRNENPANPILANVPYFLPFHQRLVLRYPWARQLPLNQRRNTLAQLNFPRTLWITAIDSYFKSRKTPHLSVTQIDNLSSLLSLETCAVTEQRFTAHSSQGVLIFAAYTVKQGHKERQPQERKVEMLFLHTWTFFHYTFALTQYHVYLMNFAAKSAC